jgi:hypothetical protein
MRVEGIGMTATKKSGSKKAAPKALSTDKTQSTEQVKEQAAKDLIEQVIEPVTTGEIGKTVEVKKEPTFRKFNKINKQEGIDGLIDRHKSKFGTEITLWNASQAGWKDVPLQTPWAAKCETHNVIEYSKSYRLAAGSSAHPENFCDLCKLAKANFEAEKLTKKEAAEKAKTEKKVVPEPTATEQAAVPETKTTKRADLAEKLVEQSKKSSKKGK